LKLKRKKKGSAFLIVVISMSLIFIAGTTMLSVTANDYKMRKNESERIKNLYEADSGLNVVENIIIKTSQQAISYADKAVKKEFSKIKEEDRGNSDINQLFKDKFYEYLSKEETYINDGKSEKVKILQYLILNKKYIDNISKDGLIIYKDSEMNRDAIITIPEEGYKVSEDGITIEVQSTFETKDGELKNKKTVSTKYTIKSPDYNAKISNVAIYPVFDNKALTIDGDLIINSGETSITGDIWVKGTDPSKDSSQYIFNKYNGGIYTKNLIFNIKGDILSANTLQLSNESNVEVEGNVYAKNIYSGKKLDEIVSNKNTLTVNNDVVVNNDLAMNSTNSIIEIKGNFYGINDKTIEGSTIEKALTSSSIIVNDISGSSKLIVDKDSYIMGVAYLNATNEGNKYQTGESVAVKGNYLAYTDVEDVSKGVVLKYYNPLQLLESMNGDNSISMKAEYFTDYFNSTDKKYSLKDGGVDLRGNVYSVGASIKYDKDKKAQVQGSNITEDQPSIINSEKNNFIIDVLTMGDGTGISNLENLYLKQEVARTVSNQINFNKIKSLGNQIIEGKEGEVILIGNGSSLNIENNIIEEKNIPLTKGLIITNGNINIKGNFNFTGNIITTGTVTLEGKNNIVYDSKLIRNILGENKEVLSEVFITDFSTQKAEEIKINSSTDIYGTDTFLNKSSWKIVK
jgi:hypothetical protein